MARPFEVRDEIEISATPEEVWEAITTGSGMDAWFMGDNEVERRLGGKVRTSLPGFEMESTITTWDPPRRFADTSPKEGDGRVMAFSFEIEGRGGGRTLLRFVHSGFLPDDDWETEVDSLREGDPAYFFKVAEYLEHFRGRRAVPVSAFGPQIDRDRAFSAFTHELGLTSSPAVGDPVDANLEAIGRIEGVVDYLSRDFLGVRTADAIYRFIHGHQGMIVLGHHVFAEVDREATDRAWQAWVDRVFA
jgi:uncharacterized protein YndB with AHSA1/START domain